eukprot:2634910-Pleurochrysis_carterae.AAC.1
MNYEQAGAHCRLQYSRNNLFTLDLQFYTFRCLVLAAFVLRRDARERQKYSSNVSFETGQRALLAQ